MTKLVVALGFCVAFAAGLMVGMQQANRTQVASNAGVSPPTTMQGQRPGRGRDSKNWLPSELNLTQQQQDAMNKIWSEVAQRGRNDQEDRRRQLRRDRDEAMAALIRPEDYGQLDQIIRTYAEQLAAIDAEQKASFDAAVQKTKQVLTPAQQTKYEELLKRHQFPGPWRGGGGPGGPRGFGGPSDGGRDRQNREHDQTRRSDDAGASSRPVTP